MEMKDIFEKVENAKDWREFRLHELGEMLESALEQIVLLEDELSECQSNLTTVLADLDTRSARPCTKCGGTIFVCRNCVRDNLVNPPNAACS